MEALKRGEGDGVNGKDGKRRRGCGVNEEKWEVVERGTV